jgi:cytoskeletal protein CcmA (bactofilin family)
MTNLLNGSDSEKSLETSSKTPATIGTSVSIKGEITGEEDVIIHGFVEGLINLKKNVVKVARSGKVQAHIYGQVIHVEGEVNGNLFGTDLVIVHKTGNVKGNITAPRISIEDGARIKGAIDTDPKSDTSIVLKDTEILKNSAEEPAISDSFVSNGSKKGSGSSIRA